MPKPAPARFQLLPATWAHVCLVDGSRQRKLNDADVRFLVIFGQSGCGKTSLIRAGVIPLLEEEGVTCVYTRPYQHPEQSLKTALQQSADKRGVVFLDQFEERSEERRVGKECRSRWSPYH